MRFLFAVLLLLPTLSFGQRSSGLWDTAFRYATDAADLASGKSVFEVTRPDIIVQVSKHRMGADMFEITAVKPNYPVQLLAQQIKKMCDGLGVPARGLRAGTDRVGGDPKLAYTKATFATDGIIDRAKGILRIAPIVQAFAGAPDPYTVHGITIMFQGEEATPNVLRSYTTPDIRLQAIANQDPPVVEYRIQLLTQDPTQLEVPDTAKPEQKPAETASTVQRNGVDWSLWIPLLAAAAAAGILVYFFMLRASAKPRR